MENSTDKVTGTRVTTQSPLDIKGATLNEETLKDLGLNNALAYTYHKSLVVTCLDTRNKYEWKEMEEGDVGLLDENFTYPNGIMTWGIDYSNKTYNFVKVTTEAATVATDIRIKNVFLNTNTLAANYTIPNLINSFLTLPAETRTLGDENSKFNIILLGDDNLVEEIYELQDQPKGVINTLDPVNVLLIFKRIIQKQFVAQLIISEKDLPLEYDESDIATYIMNLPEAQRTIPERASKLNIIIIEAFQVNI